MKFSLIMMIFLKELPFLAVHLADKEHDEAKNRGMQETAMNIDNIRPNVYWISMNWSSNAYMDFNLQVLIIHFFIKDFDFFDTVLNNIGSRSIIRLSWVVLSYCHDLCPGLYV